MLVDVEEKGKKKPTRLSCSSVTTFTPSSKDMILDCRTDKNNKKIAD